MLNPDRAELELQPTLVPESPKKNGHFPRWLGVPAFAIRTSLAILAASPGMAVAADTIFHIENPAIVYADGTPTGRITTIQRVGDCAWDVTVEVTDLRPNARLTGTNYYNLTDCKGNHSLGSYGPYDLGVTDNSGRNITVHHQYDYGSYSKIITDSDGHQLIVEYSYDRNYNSNTPIPTSIQLATPSRPILTPEATSTKVVAAIIPSVTKTVEAAVTPVHSSSASEGKGSNLATQLVGLGATFLAGWLAKKLYEKWKRKKLSKWNY